MNDVKQLQNIATQVRRDIIRMICASQSGHPGGSLGCADFMTALYFNVMNASPQTFTADGKNQDMFFLSNGHIAPVWYSVLARAGYFDVKELGTLRKLHSKLQGHPTNYVKGVRIASGSLGQGLSVACGVALAKKMNGDPNTVFTLHGDGELQEGQIWEATMFAAAKKIDNLIAAVDYNGQQIDGAVDDVLSLGNLPAKFSAFGWEVIHINGNDMSELITGFAKAKSLTGKGKPIVVLMETEMGQGVDFMMGTHKWHGKAPNEEQTLQALAQLPETLGDY
ncbi:MAG: transketolase [Prevotellaceae bacterium]|jgi:transketolase|nr:transketolase [Prevotellaceae bacterium]